jgi:hypothetical protein
VKKLEKSEAQAHPVNAKAAPIIVAEVKNLRPGDVDGRPSVRCGIAANL